MSRKYDYREFLQRANPATRTRLRCSRLVWLGSTFLILTGLVSATLFMNPLSTLTSTSTGVSNPIVCGFEQGPYWDKIGSGVPPNSPYIQATPALNPYTVGPVVPSVSIAAYAYGGGSGTEEYLVSEVSFFCTSLPSGTTTLTLTVSDTTPLGASATHAVVFLQDTWTSGSPSNADPTTAGACVGTSPNLLYEPAGGGTMWAWDAEANSGSGGAISSTLGTCPNNFAAAPMTQALTSASSASPVITLSFGFVGVAASTCLSSCATFTTYDIGFIAEFP